MKNSKIKALVSVLLLVAAILSGCAEGAQLQGAVKAPIQSAAAETPTAVFDGSGVVWQETPNSTCFAYVGYDKDFQKLAVIFRSSPDRVYVYSDFKQKDMDAFLADPSLGGYYNKYIKGQFACKRIDDGIAFFKKGK